MSSEPVPLIFEAAYYARLADIERRHWWALGLRAMATRLLDRTLGAPAPLEVLDAGCGTGLTMSWVRRYSTLAPTGLDYAREALDYCAESGHRKLVLGTATTLPFPAARFDLVLSADVVQHLPRPGGDVDAFAEVTRVLKPGGWFLLRTNSRCGQPVESTADYHRYDCAEIRQLLRDAGLVPEVVSYANGVPGVLTTLRRLLERRRKPTGDPGLWITAQPPGSSLVATLMYRVMLVEAWWVGTLRASIPFGHSIVALARKPLA